MHIAHYSKTLYSTVAKATDLPPLLGWFTNGLNFVIVSCRPVIEFFYPPINLSETIQNLSGDILIESNDSCTFVLQCTLVIVNAWIVNNLSLVNIFGETGRFFYNINYMLNSEHLSLVNKIGDKTEFTITRVHCSTTIFYLIWILKFYEVRSERGDFNWCWFWAS